MNYSVVVADQDRDRATLLDVWRGRLGDAHSADEKLQWFYKQNPAGPSTLLILRHQETTPVGVAGLGARVLFARGRPLLAGMLVDFLVLPEHRTAYPAILLQRTMSRVGFATHTVLYGLPNEKSLPIVLRLGYTHVGDLVRYALVLRSAQYLERWAPGWVSAIGGSVADRVVPMYFRPHRALRDGAIGDWTTDIDTRFDELWSRARRFDGVIGTRDRRFLQWRFAQRTDAVTRLFVIARPGTTSLEGYAVCESDGDTLRVRDVLVDSSRPDALHVLMHLLARRAFSEGFAKMFVEFLGSASQRAQLEAAGMVERERHPFFASFGEHADDAMRQCEWYVTRADLDV